MDSVYADAPFDHEKADIILRSSDNVNFRVFKLFLSLASPFFQTLFEIPQPADATEDQEVKDGLVVVPVTENSKILDALLRFCYPCTLADDPELEVLKDAADVLEAARKYSLDVIEKRARKAIVNPKFLEVEPLRCFVIAYQGRLKEEMALSARYTLMQPLIPTWFEELELITAADFLTLLTYHKRCGDMVHALRADRSWIASHYGYTEACSCSRKTERHDGREGRHHHPTLSQPWEKFVDDVFSELRDKPCRGTVKAAAEKAVQAIGRRNCQTCTSEVTHGMRDFADLLTRKVEEAVSQIELDLNF